MKWLALFLLAGPLLHMEITDARGRKASGVVIEAGAPDADGWCQLTLTKSAKNKADVILVWPFVSRLVTRWRQRSGAVGSSS